ncbi:MAG: glutathione S-transferase family protein [Thermoplasmata archaeon]|nr:glutathione S-transferase family protein [Thermoplasmata archaeon]
MAPRASLYYMPISHWCVCAERILAYKGIHADIVRVPYHDKRALLAATGQDYVPALVWDGRVVPWKEIPGFLESERPTPTLFPGGQRGAAEALDEWGHLIVEERVWRYVVTKATSTFQDPVERWVFEEIQNRVRGPWSLLEQRREEFKADLVPVLAKIDRMLEDRSWVLGNAASLADFGIYGGLSPLFSIGESIPDGLPRLAAWLDRVRRIGTTPTPPPPAAASPGRSKPRSRPKPKAKPAAKRSRR